MGKATLKFYQMVKGTKLSVFMISWRTEARGRLQPNLVPMLEQNNDVKGYFFRAGQCAALSSFKV